MKIRKAEKKDIPRILALLGQVLQIHAEIIRIFLYRVLRNTPPASWQSYWNRRITLSMLP